jgi:hypothetical protein
MKKYYIAKSINGNEFGIATEENLDPGKYSELTEVTAIECHELAKKTELVIILGGGEVSRYKYNSARGEFDLVYSSAGTKFSANDWGFAR